MPATPYKEPYRIAGGCIQPRWCYRRVKESGSPLNLRCSSGTIPVLLAASSCEPLHLPWSVPHDNKTLCCHADPEEGRSKCSKAFPFHLVLHWPRRRQLNRYISRGRSQAERDGRSLHRMRCSTQVSPSCRRWLTWNLALEPIRTPCQASKDLPTYLPTKNDVLRSTEYLVLAPTSRTGLPIIAFTFTSRAHPLVRSGTTPTTSFIGNKALRFDGMISPAQTRPPRPDARHVLWPAGSPIGAPMKSDLS
ncbi:hypothetical protein J3F83DRAFT_94535 [Trichoderma novae-zelandiae]